MVRVMEPWVVGQLVLWVALLGLGACVVFLARGWARQRRALEEMRTQLERVVDAGLTADEMLDVLVATLVQHDVIRMKDIHRVRKALVEEPRKRQRDRAALLDGLSDQEDLEARLLDVDPSIKH